MEARFRDETAAVLNIIETHFAAQGRTIYTGDETPDAGFEGKLPFVRADSVGGNDNQVSDFPVLDVDVYATTRRDSKEIAEEIRQLLLSRPHPLDSVRTLMRPQRVKWVEDSDIRRFYASYHLSLRR